MRSIGVFLLALVYGCAPSTPDAEQGTVARVVRLAGFTVEAPLDTAWVLIESDRTHANFRWEYDSSSASLVAQAVEIDSAVDDHTFLQTAEADLKTAVGALEVVSRHFNQIRFNGASCLQYDGIYRDIPAMGTESEFLATKGYLCRHPSSPGQAVKLEFKQRSTSRMPPAAERTRATADDFFESAAFTGRGTSG